MRQTRKTNLFTKKFGDMQYLFHILKVRKAVIFKPKRFHRQDLNSGIQCLIK